MLYTWQDCISDQGFVVGMKLEAVDLPHPSFVCVATVADISGSKLLIDFDGWTDKYDPLLVQ